MAKIPNDEERKEIDLEPIYEKPKKLVEQESITKFHFNPDSYQVDYDSGDITLALDKETSSFFNDFLLSNYVYSPRFKSPTSVAKDLFENLNHPLIKSDNFEEVLINNKEKVWSNLGKFSYLDNSRYINCLLLLESTTGFQDESNNSIPTKKLFGSMGNQLFSHDLLTGDTRLECKVWGNIISLTSDSYGNVYIVSSTNNEGRTNVSDGSNTNNKANMGIVNVYKWAFKTNSFPNISGRQDYNKKLKRILTTYYNGRTDYIEDWSDFATELGFLYCNYTKYDNTEASSNNSEWKTTVGWYNDANNSINSGHYFYPCQSYEYISEEVTRDGKWQGLFEKTVLNKTKTTFDYEFPIGKKLVETLSHYKEADHKAWEFWKFGTKEPVYEKISKEKAEKVTLKPPSKVGMMSQGFHWFEDFLYIPFDKGSVFGLMRIPCPNEETGFSNTILDDLNLPKPFYKTTEGETVDNINNDNITKADVPIGSSYFNMLHTGFSWETYRSYNGKNIGLFSRTNLFQINYNLIMSGDTSEYNDVNSSLVNHHTEADYEDENSTTKTGRYHNKNMSAGTITNNTISGMNFFGGGFKPTRTKNYYAFIIDESSEFKSIYDNTGSTGLRYGSWTIPASIIHISKPTGNPITGMKKLESKDPYIVEAESQLERIFTDDLNDRKYGSTDLGQWTNTSILGHKNNKQQRWRWRHQEIESMYDLNTKLAENDKNSPTDSQRFNNSTVYGLGGGVTLGRSDGSHYYQVHRSIIGKNVHTRVSGVKQTKRFENNNTRNNSVDTSSTSGDYSSNSTKINWESSIDYKGCEVFCFNGPNEKGSISADRAGLKNHYNDEDLYYPNFNADSFNKLPRTTHWGDVSGMIIHNGKLYFVVFDWTNKGVEELGWNDLTLANLQAVGEPHAASIYCIDLEIDSGTNSNSTKLNTCFPFSNPATDTQKKANYSSDSEQWYRNDSTLEEVFGENESYVWNNNETISKPVSQTAKGGDLTPTTNFTYQKDGSLLIQTLNPNISSTALSGDSTIISKNRPIFKLTKSNETEQVRIKRISNETHRPEIVQKYKIEEGSRQEENDRMELSEYSSPRSPFVSGDFVVYLAGSEWWRGSRFSSKVQFNPHAMDGKAIFIETIGKEDSGGSLTKLKFGKAKDLTETDNYVNGFSLNQVIKGFASNSVTDESGSVFVVSGKDAIRMNIIEESEDYKQSKRADTNKLLKIEDSSDGNGKKIKVYENELWDTVSKNINYNQELIEGRSPLNFSIMKFSTELATKIPLIETNNVNYYDKIENLAKLVDAEFGFENQAPYFKNKTNVSSLASNDQLNTTLTARDASSASNNNLLPNSFLEGDYTFYYINKEIIAVYNTTESGEKIVERGLFGTDVLLHEGGQNLFKIKLVANEENIISISNYRKDFDNVYNEVNVSFKGDFVKVKNNAQKKYQRTYNVSISDIEDGNWAKSLAYEYLNNVSIEHFIVDVSVKLTPDLKNGDYIVIDCDEYSIDSRLFQVNSVSHSLSDYKTQITAKSVEDSSIKLEYYNSSNNWINASSGINLGNNILSDTEIEQRIKITNTSSDDLVIHDIIIPEFKSYELYTMNGGVKGFKLKRSKEGFYGSEAEKATIIKPNENKEYVLVFTTKNLTNLDAQIGIITNAQVNPIKYFSITGSMYSLNFSLDVESLSFGDINTSQPKSLYFTLSNLSEYSVKVRGFGLKFSQTTKDFIDDGFKLYGITSNSGQDVKTELTQSGMESSPIDLTSFNFSKTFLLEFNPSEKLQNGEYRTEIFKNKTSSSNVNLILDLETGNPSETTISSSITKTSTTINLASSLSSLALNDILLIDDEEVKVTYFSGTTLTVERGINNTVARSHASSSRIVIAKTIISTRKSSYKSNKNKIPIMARIHANKAVPYGKDNIPLRRSIATGNYVYNLGLTSDSYSDIKIRSIKADYKQQVIKNISKGAFNVRETHGNFFDGATPVSLANPLKDFVDSYDKFPTSITEADFKINTPSASIDVTYDFRGDDCLKSKFVLIYEKDSSIHEYDDVQFSIVKYNNLGAYVSHRRFKPYALIKNGTFEYEDLFNVKMKFTKAILNSSTLMEHGTSTADVLSNSDSTLELSIGLTGLGESIYSLESTNNSNFTNYRKSYTFDTVINTQITVESSTELEVGDDIYIGKTWDQTTDNKDKLVKYSKEYHDVDIKSYDSLPSTTISQTISNSAGTVNVASVDGFVKNQLIKINSEILLITAVNRTSTPYFSITRGVRSTDAATHNSGASVSTVTDSTNKLYNLRLENFEDSSNTSKTHNFSSDERIFIKQSNYGKYNGIHETNVSKSDSSYVYLEGTSSLSSKSDDSIVVDEDLIIYKSHKVKEIRGIKNQIVIDHNYMGEDIIFSTAKTSDHTNTPTLNKITNHKMDTIDIMLKNEPDIIQARISNRVFDGSRYNLQIDCLENLEVFPQGINLNQENSIKFLGHFGEYLGENFNKRKPKGLGKNKFEITMPQIGVLGILQIEDNSELGSGAVIFLKAPSDIYIPNTTGNNSYQNYENNNTAGSNKDWDRNRYGTYTIPFKKGDNILLHSIGNDNWDNFEGRISLVAESTYENKSSSFPSYPKLLYVSSSNLLLPDGGSQPTIIGRNNQDLESLAIFVEGDFKDRGSLLLNYGQTGFAQKVEKYSDSSSSFVEFSLDSNTNKDSLRFSTNTNKPYETYIKSFNSNTEQDTSSDGVGIRKAKTASILREGGNHELTSTVTDSATQISITNLGVDVGTKQINDFIKIEDEIMQITSSSISGTTITMNVSRGQKGTIAVQHSSGKKVENISKSLVETIEKHELTSSENIIIYGSSSYDGVYKVDTLINDYTFIIENSFNGLLPIEEFTIENSYIYTTNWNSGNKYLKKLYDTTSLPNVSDGLKIYGSGGSPISNSQVNINVNWANLEKGGVDLSIDDILIIDSEKVKVTAIDTTSNNSYHTITVIRGFEDTVATTHALGTKIYSSKGDNVAFPGKLFNSSLLRSFGSNKNDRNRFYHSSFDRDSDDKIDIFDLVNVINSQYSLMSDLGFSLNKYPKETSETIQFGLITDNLLSFNSEINNINSGLTDFDKTKNSEGNSQIVFSTNDPSNPVLPIDINFNRYKKNKSISVYESNNRGFFNSKINVYDLHEDFGYEQSNKKIDLTGSVTFTDMDYSTSDSVELIVKNTNLNSNAIITAKIVDLDSSTTNKTTLIYPKFKNGLEINKYPLTLQIDDTNFILEPNSSKKLNLSYSSPNKSQLKRHELQSILSSSLRDGTKMIENLENDGSSFHLPKVIVLSSNELINKIPTKIDSSGEYQVNKRFLLLEVVLSGSNQQREDSTNISSQKDFIKIPINILPSRNY